MKTNDVVILSLAKDLLEQHDIPTFVMDSNQSIMVGALGMVYQRLMVVDEDYVPALEILIEADLKEHLWRG